MSVEDSVAQDQLRAFIERIERMESEKSEIAADIKSIYAEAKGNGFDTKILRKIVAIRKQDANERMEQDALLDLYMGALGMVAAPPEDDDYTRPFGSNTDRAPTIDQLVERLADQIDPKLLMTIIEGSKTEAGRKIIMGALAAVNGGEVVSAAHIENAEPQPETAAQTVTAVVPVVTSPVESEAVEISTPTPDVDKSVEAPASAAPASIYPAPGEVYWENTPRKPVHRHDYSVAFGDLGQDHCVITEDISKAQAAPIVMIGETILDGWARYNCARCTVGLDGQTAYYPAVQYDGTDPLMDCIRWNMEGRILNESQRRLIAKRLVALEPKRKADIFKALDMGMELIA